MKNNLSTIAGLMMLFCLGGCVLPASGNYFAPTAAEGEITGIGDNYAPDTIRIKRGDGLIIRIWGQPFYDKYEMNRSIGITLIVSPGVKLHMPADQIKIVSKEGVEIAQFSSASVSNNRDRYQKLETAGSDFDGDLIPGNPYGDWYDLWYQFDASKPEVFKVELPAMSYGGTDYPPLEVTFTLTHGWWWQVYGP